MRVLASALVAEPNPARDTGVSVLMDIPGISKLFSTTGVVALGSELVVLITPRVVDPGHDTTIITNEFQQKISALETISHETKVVRPN